MQPQPARSYTRLAIAIAVAAVMVSGAIVAFPRSTVTSTVTITTTIGPTASTSSITSSSNTTDILIPRGTTYQVQSSYDCLAGHNSNTLFVTTRSLLSGGISTTPPGVTLYVSSASDATTTESGHPATWTYSSGLTNSTTFSLLLAPGTYVLWTEGADLNCEATTVTPLEQETTVTVMQSIALVPA